MNNFDLDEILEKEFCLVLSIKSLNITNYELQFTIYQENSYPYSMTSVLDASKASTV